MTDRIADNADAIVDDMKRKARRRLIGAIVLALAGAIVLPMLLEKEPRPLGEDVTVKIPPIDEGKFVNRLTGKSGDAKALPKADDKADAKGSAAKAEAKEANAAASSPSAPASAVSGGNAVSAASVPGDAAPAKKSVAEAEQRALAPATRPATKAPRDLAPSAETRSDPAPTGAETKNADVETQSAPVVVALPGNPAPAVATPAAPPAKAEGFVVQLAAFADDKGANALANKLKKAGHAAFVEPVQTSRGTLWRVRVGGFGTRPDAEIARATLKGEGYSGIVAPAN